MRPRRIGLNRGLLLGGLLAGVGLFLGPAPARADGAAVSWWQCAPPSTSNPNGGYCPTGQQYPLPVGLASTYTHISTNTTTLVKSGQGWLHCLTLNTKGAASNTITIYDGLSAAGATMGILDGTVAPGSPFCYDVPFSTGLTIVTATGTAPDLTVSTR